MSDEPYGPNDDGPLVSVGEDNVVTGVVGVNAPVAGTPHPRLTGGAA